MIAVVGGGMAGLAAAFEASRAGAEVTLLEREPRLGGKVLTEHLEGFFVEGGPDGFLVGKEAVLELAEELGLGDRVVFPRASGISVWWEGRLHPVPAGLLLMVPGRLGPVLRSSLLSWRGKLRLLAEPLVPARRGEDDESLESFVTRRLGKEVLERIAEPLVAGIHVAPPERMSLQASFPRLLEMERRHGSLLRAARRIGREADRQGDPGHLASFREGMGELVEGLVSHLERADLRTGTEVMALEAEGEGYRLLSAAGDALSVTSVVLAVPAQPAAHLLSRVAPEAAGVVEDIGRVSIASVSLAYRRTDVGAPLKGLGFVVPAAAGREIEGVSYQSEKWEGRVPDGRHVLLRVFLKDELNAEAALATARRELAGMLGITAPPVFSRLHLWPEGIHSYRLGHLERVARAERAVASRAGLFLAGSAYHGIGLNECVASGRRAGHRAAEWTRRA